MPVAIVRLPAWLREQTLFGEPVPERWRRAVERVGYTAKFVGVDDTRSGDLVIDGTVLNIPHARLAEVASGGRSLVLSQPLAGEDDDPSPFEGLVVAAAAGSDHPVGSVVSPESASVHVLDPWEHPKVTDVTSLMHAESAMDGRAQAWANHVGVRFCGNPGLIDPEVVFDGPCTIWDGVYLLGPCRIGRGAVIHPGCHLVRSRVGPGSVLKPYTVCEDADVRARVTVGPFAHLRPGTVLKDGSKVGNFVETKKTTLHEGAKANHLAYLGDADVGAGANVGAGTITCNYDGARKHRTEIGAGAFIGTNSSLVAPVNVGDGALVAAGSVITKDVPDGALAVGRADQATTEDKGAEILARNAAAKRKNGSGT